LHLDLNVRKPILEILGVEAVLGTHGAERSISIIELLEYLPFVFMTVQSTLVLIDNGDI
jgi:hypothetical protein